MKNITKVVPYLLMMGLLIVGCAAPVDSMAVDPEFVEPTFSLEKIDNGQYVYDSSVGQVIWYEQDGKGRVQLMGEDFAVFSTNSAQFTFPDGRTMSAQVDRDGSVETVSVAPGVVVGAYDHEYIVLSTRVAMDALNRAQHVSVRNGIWMLVLLALGMILLFLTPWILGIVGRYVRMEDSAARQYNVLLRAGGVVLAVIPIIVFIATGGNFR